LSDSLNSANFVKTPAVADFWVEILAQPDCWKALEDYFQPSPPIPLPFHPQRIVCFGEGSSLHALRMATPFLKQAFGCPILCLQPHEVAETLLLSYQLPTVWITASQSGKTHSILTMLDELAQNPQTSNWSHTWVAFTNESASPIALHPLITDSLPVLAGTELCIPATKSVSSCCVSIVLWANALNNREKGINQGLHQTTEWLQSTNLADLAHAFLTKASNTRSQPRPAVLIGPTQWQPLLDEVALKWTETRSQPVLVYETEAFHHGPRALAASTTPLDFWLWGDFSDPALLSTAQWLNTHAHPSHTLRDIHCHSVEHIDTELNLPSRFHTLSLPFHQPLEGLLKSLLLAQSFTAIYCTLEHLPINHPLLQKFLPPKAGL
jgi:fructoselysine-6-P-deglycase FrlB-like protein